jgi:hypothetical protein
MHTFDPMAKKRGSYIFDQLAAAHRSRAAAEGQKRDLVPGIPGPQRPEGDQGRFSGCLRRARARLSQPLRHRRPGVPCRRRPFTLLQASLAEKLVADTLFDSWRGGSRPGISNGRPDGRGASLHVGGEDSPRAGGCSVPGGRTLWPAPCRPLLGRRPPAP